MAQTNTSESLFNIQIADQLTNNVMPLLHEIKHALQNLADNNETSIIDLRSIPLAPGEEEKIIETLGQGEIQAQLHALGTSEIIESQYPGVWIINHYNQENELISRFIEVTFIPDIICSQKDDVSDAVKQLTITLNENSPTNTSAVEK